jgi:hypothetical protein
MHWEGRPPDRVKPAKGDVPVGSLGAQRPRCRELASCEQFLQGSPAPPQRLIQENNAGHLEHVKDNQVGRPLQRRPPGCGTPAPGPFLQCGEVEPVRSPHDQLGIQDRLDAERGRG